MSVFGLIVVIILVAVALSAVAYKKGWFTPAVEAEIAKDVKKVEDEVKKVVKKL